MKRRDRLRRRISGIIVAKCPLELDINTHRSGQRILNGLRDAVRCTPLDSYSCLPSRYRVAAIHSTFILFVWYQKLYLKAFHSNFAAPAS